MDKNGKFIRVKKNVCLAFLTKIWDPENFIFTSENSQKRPNEGGSGKMFLKKLPGTLPTTAMLIVFYKKSLEDQNKIKTEKTHIDRGKIGGGTYCG